MRFLPIALCLTFALPATHGQGGASSLIWSGEDGAPAWSVSLDVAEGDPSPAPGGESLPLEVPSWFVPLPDLKVPLLDGGGLDLKSVRGKVLLLDFWASWCGPCVQELPHLQALFDREKNKGLDAVAVNVEEPADVARAFAKRLGLTLPVGLLDAELDKAFGPRTLPTLILADRRGRIRGRWDGYRPGLERKIADRVQALLVESHRGPVSTLGHVLLGQGLLESKWGRELTGPVEGIAVDPGPPRLKARLAVALRGRLYAMDADGNTVERFEAPVSVSSLRTADLDGNGKTEIVGFRPGGTDLLQFDLELGLQRTLKAPAPVTDATLVPAGAGGPSSGALIVGTARGLYRIGSWETEPRLLGEPMAVVACAASRSGSQARIRVLDAEGALRTLDVAGAALPERRALAGTGRLLVDPLRPGLGLLPKSVVAAATGRFLPGPGRQAAVATASGRLILVDLDEGKILWIVEIAKIGDLASGDLDGDGKDELVVAAERTIAVLGAPPPSPNDR